VFALHKNTLESDVGFRVEIAAHGGKGGGRRLADSGREKRGTIRKAGRVSMGE
jgi:hypothetical protein